MNGVGRGEKAIGFLVSVSFLNPLLAESSDFFFWLQTGHWVVRKIVLYVICFASSLLSLVVVFLFPLLPY